MTRRKKNIIAVVFVAVVAFAGGFFFTEPSYRGLVTMPDDTVVFAHRGFGNLAPDNSLSGALLALEAGMDGVDVDSQITKDGELVIFHDLSVDRLTDSTGRVDGKTLNEMLSLDLGPTYGHGFSGASVATFEDFFPPLTRTRLPLFPF